MTYGSLNSISGMGVNSISLAPAAVAVFDPTSITGLVLWFDATTGVYADNGSNPAVANQSVQQWNDRSASGNNLSQATASKRPIYTTNQLNGLPTVIFDGIDDYLKVSTMTLNQPSHVFAVFKMIVYSGVQGRVYDGSTLNSMLLYEQGPTPTLGMYAGGVGPQSTAMAVGSYAITDAIFSGSTSALRVNNGTKNTSGNIGSNNAGGFTVGAAGDTTLPSNLAFAEILVYNAALSDANAALVNAYLATKWGITIS